MTSTIDPRQRIHEGEPTRTLPEDTPTQETLRLLATWRARLVASPTELAHVDEIACVDRAVATINSLQRETRGLRRALLSRATIDQAKGMIMAERRCDADAAFQVLAKMSADANVPLRDVARALVYQAVRH